MNLGKKKVVIRPITQRFIASFKRLNDAGKLPQKKELAAELGINSPSTLSNILNGEQNIGAKQWVAFKTKYKIQDNSESDGKNYQELYEDLVMIYSEMMKEYNEMIKEYNECLKTNSGTLEEAVSMNQKLIYYLYEQLKISPPQKNRDKFVNGNVEGNQ